MPLAIDLFCGEAGPGRQLQDHFAAKLPGFRFDGSGRSFQSDAVAEHRKGKGSWFGDYAAMRDGCKQGGEWFNASQPIISRMSSSKSPARKAVSALIAKIPLPLARHIGRSYL